jgi:hypothetical protein
MTTFQDHPTGAEAIEKPVRVPMGKVTLQRVVEADVRGFSAELGA